SLGAGVAEHEFSYDDADPWPAGADSAGASLVLFLPEERPDHALAENWVAGATASPGEATDLSVKRFEVSTAVNGEGSLVVTPETPEYPEGSVIQVTAVPAEGWAFASWEGPCEGQGNPLSITVNADITVTAS